MAWTAPKTWSVGEVVTAANMNTHIKDNLRYLKGTDGPITLDSNLSVTGTIAATSTITSSSTLRAQSATPGMWLDETDGATKGGYLVLDGGLLQIQRRATAFGAFEAAVGNIDITAPASSLVIDSNGWVGLGRGTPQGRLHGYDSISGFLKWEYNGVDSTARTVIPNGTGDVIGRISGLYAIQNSNGVNSGGLLSSTSLVPGGGDVTLLADADGNTFAIRVNADGSVDVRRSVTGGTSRTAKVSLWLLWL